MWTPRDANPTTPPARMRQVTILAGADPEQSRRLDPTLSSELCRARSPRQLNAQLISLAPLLHTGLPIGGASPCLPASLEHPVTARDRAPGRMPAARPLGTELI
ncbi:uncharacterized protein TrAtP1_003080 [Trichoderma atroviride]|uniref:uncharacterized protein n=1 Tax=Hypocrea atroviridis TaxID=63577 RepID=UPI0033206EE0|nr:hypothetical protein TrAtP1_003080 [Trichoderma atroviride]